MPRPPVVALVVFGLSAFVGPPCRAQWSVQESGTKARLRGLSVVDHEVAWATGAKGTVIVTTDGGTTWRARPVPGAGDLDFRDVHAVDDRSAYLLSIGEGDKSRIYKTNDGGGTWVLQHTNRDPKGFLDAIAFWDPEHSLALGDPVEGRYTILTTDDGGLTWTKGNAEGMPPALTNEGAFAASGTCLVTEGGKNAWFGTGGGKTARVFRSVDRGRTWTVHETPLRAATPTSGIFSLAFRDSDHGVVVGGTYDQANRGGRVAATTKDGGKSWTLADGPEPGGFRSAVAFVERGNHARLVAVGPSGSDISGDDGRIWKPLGTMGFHAVSFRGTNAGWAVGEDGRIAKYTGR
ncbi:MAG: glycosyl hydrolase [Planctomycetota bacterium]|nr:glycosyl hydrolase [Planctomycetota bacterium]